MEYNIGDDLCRASLYFDLPSNINVIEGGTYVFGNETAEDVTWAVGRSVKPGQGASRPNGKAALYSCRDKTDNMRFVPCPSVFHPIVDIPPGDQTVLIVGGSDTIDRDVSSVSCSVALPLESYKECFTKADKVITNSYHTAYWSLLSGRKVKLIGYSSKFTSLLKIFDIDSSNVIMYPKGDYDSFKGAVQTAKTYPWLSTSSHYKDLFRDLNYKFYNALSRYS